MTRGGRRPAGPHFGLNRKLVALAALVAALAVSMTALLGYGYAEQALRERAAAQLAGEAETRGGAVLLLLEARVRETQALSADPEVRALVAGISAAPPQGRAQLAAEARPDFLRRVQAFQELVGFSIGVEDVQVIGAGGRALFSLAELGGGADLSGSRQFAEGMRGPSAYFEPSGGGKKLVVAVPVMPPGGDGAPAGVVAARMRTAGIDGILLSRGGLGETGEAYMVGAGGLMLTESRFAPGAVFSREVPGPPVAECLGRGLGHSGDYENYLGEAVHGASFCAPDRSFVLVAEAGRAEVGAPLRGLAWSMLQAGAAVAAGTALLALALSRRISAPLARLRDAANDVARGDFDVETAIRSRDEIGDLSESFDRMARRLRESLAEVRAGEDVIRRQEDVLIRFSERSQRRCVCMVDVIGSTEATASLSERQTGDFYRSFLNAMAAIVGRFGGAQVKNIGDALLFSFPDGPDGGEFGRAIECCLSMCEASGGLASEMAAAGLPAVSYRISAAHGPVRVARPPQSAADDIFGPAVNRCAKLNRSAPPNGLVVDEGMRAGAAGLPGYSFRRAEPAGGFAGYVVTRDGAPRGAEKK